MQQDTAQDTALMPLQPRRVSLPFDTALLAGQLRDSSRAMYARDIAAVYAVSDIVVCRAGASTLAELAVIGKPAILVPYPFAAENHQMANARVFAQAGAAHIVEDGALSGHTLRDLLERCLEPRRLAGMAQAARSLSGIDPISVILRRMRALLHHG